MGEASIKTGRNGSRIRAERRVWHQEVKRQRMNVVQHLLLPRLYVFHLISQNCPREPNVLPVDCQLLVGSCGDVVINIMMTNPLIDVIPAVRSRSIKINYYIQTNELM